MNRFFVKGFGILLAVMVFFTLLSRAASSFLVPQIIVEKPSGKKIEHMIRAEGIAQKSLEFPVLTQEGLLVKTVYVQEGSMVEQGETLAEIDLLQLEERIGEIKDEIKVLTLTNETLAGSLQKEQREKEKQLRRASEDYSRMQREREEALSRLAEEVRQAEEAIDRLAAESGAQKEEAWKNYFAKRQAYEAAEREWEKTLLQAERAIEDAGETAAIDHSREINEIAIAQKEKDLRACEEIAQREGKILAQEAGCVTGIFVQSGQKTADTAAFTLAYAQGGVLLMAEITEEDARWAEDNAMVTVEKNGTSYEDFSVDSKKQKEDGSVELYIRSQEHAEKFPMGEGAEVILIHQSEIYPYTVPLSAIHTEQNRNYVYVAEERDTVLGSEYFTRSVEVKIIEKNSSYAAVEEGSLTSDSLVVVDSDAYVGAGDKVRLQET